MNKLTPSPRNTILILLLILEVLFLAYLIFPVPIIEMIVIIYGGFVATLAGVYWSLYLSKKNEETKDIKLSKKRFLGSLKLIHNELEIDGRIAQILVKNLSAIEPNLKYIPSQFKDIKKTSLLIKTNAYYGVISSGGMDEISNHDDVFNSIQKAYHNLNLAIATLETGESVLSSVSVYDNTPDAQKILEGAMEFLNGELETFKNNYNNIHAAILLMKKYFEENGINLNK
jgi:hypothetical protein